MRYATRKWLSSKMTEQIRRKQAWQRTRLTDLERCRAASCTFDCLHRLVQAAPNICASSWQFYPWPLPHSNPCPSWHLNPTSSPNRHHSGDSQGVLSPASRGISPWVSWGIWNLNPSQTERIIPSTTAFPPLNSLLSLSLFPSLIRVATMYPQPA